LKVILRRTYLNILLNPYHTLAFSTMLPTSHSAPADLSGHGHMKRKAEEVIFDVQLVARHIMQQLRGEHLLADIDEDDWAGLTTKIVKNTQVMST
jgi:hypothetical protein